MTEVDVNGDRDYWTEAWVILDGWTMLLPQVEHLQALATRLRDMTLSYLEAIGVLDPKCPACQEFYQAPRPWNVVAPLHRASTRCESGRRPHCTCDTCF